MNDIRMDVTEQQMDKLAGRLAEVERMLEALLGTLSAPDISARIGLTAPHIKRIRHTFLTIQNAELRHHNARAEAVAEAEKNRIFRRLRSDPGLAFPEERRKLSGLDAIVARLQKKAASASKRAAKAKTPPSRRR
jgi:hypothetical protein